MNAFAETIQVRPGIPVCKPADTERFEQLVVDAQVRFKAEYTGQRVKTAPRKTQ